MALVAGDIKLEQSLNDPLKAIASKGSKRLEDVLGRITSRFRSGQEASGRTALPNDYFSQEIGATRGASERGLEDVLYGSLGQGSYKNLINQRDHLRKMALAKEVGRINQPSVLQEILRGVGQLGPALPGLMSGGKALYQSFQPDIRRSYPVSPNYATFDPRLTTRPEDFLEMSLAGGY